jgi:ABC-type lipoprotein release transport system permease subunit
MMKNKLFIFINVFGLAIGIGCSIVAYFNWEYNTYFDSHHANADKIYRVSMIREFEGNTKLYGLAPVPLGEITKQLTDINSSARFSNSWANIKVGDNLFDGNLAYVDPEFFEMFSFSFLSGRPSDIKDKTRIFISDELALKLFGNVDALGKQLTLVNGTDLKEYQVGGVFKKQPANSSFDRSSYVNYENIFDDNKDFKRDDWKIRNTVFLKIDDPSRKEAVHKQLQAYCANNNKVREDFVVKEYALDPFVKMARRDSDNDTWSNTNRGSPPAAVIAPTVMALLVLLIACFNMTNTSIAISSRRLKEIGIRKVMGSMRSQLIFQFIGETLFVCFIALLIGMLMGEALIQSWNSLWPEMKLTSHYEDNLGFVIFLACTLLFTGLISGSYPAFYISKFEPVSILKGKLRFGGTNWFTRILLCLQYAFSLLGIIYAIAFYQNSIYQRDFDLGVQPDGMIVAYLENSQECETYSNALLENKDIQSVTSSQHSIYSAGYNDPVKFESKQLEVDIIHVGDNYLKTMGLTLLKGRDFEKDSETDRKESIIISEKFAETFKWDNPIGKEILWRDTVKLYVVGVVKNVYTNGLWDEMDPLMIRYAEKKDHSIVLVKAPIDKVTEVNSFMEKKWATVFPNRIYAGRYVNGGIVEAHTVNNNIVKMFVFLGIVALLLSATGLFTLVSLNIIKRMKEIGVRKVLGASVSNITRVINTEFVIILVIASIIGCGAGYLLVDAMMDSIWDYYEATGTLTFMISISLMFVVSALTIGSKVLSAASMNPVNTLRDE